MEHKTAVVDPSRYERVSFTRIISYQTGDVEVRFVPVDTLPESSHFVLIIQLGIVIGTDELSDKFHPSYKMAEFYYNKHIHGVYER